MRIAELDIPQEVKEILHKQGLEELYPPQEDAIKTGVLGGRNLVMASPTASGKTLIAQLCALRHIMERGGKVIYLTPLRALTWEKYEEFQAFTGLRRLDGRKIRVGVSTGDMDNASPWLQAYDIVICTNEKCDSLLRHRSPWMEGITLVVADEIHLIGNDRGPTLEVALARLRQMSPNLQVLALSATVSNADEVAEWLNAESVTTEWRPVELLEGVAQGSAITFSNRETKSLEPHHGSSPINVAMNSVLDGGQTLIFAESRRRTMSQAREAANALIGTLSRRDTAALQKVASDISYHGEKTSLTDQLANAVSRGAAFHHAGLSREHRRIVEAAFKAGNIKILTATPTLASGVNLPARTVVISSYKRFVPGLGMYPIPVLEYKQMSGRAGRPQYDEYGHAILIASSPDEQDAIMEGYILAKPERIYSRLAQESALRGHTLAAIASDYAHTEGGLLDFFGETFYGYHYPATSIKLILSGMLRYLAREDMIEYKGDYLYATDFGRRVSELYIDPFTGVVMRDGLRKGALDVTDFTWLHLICHTPDMRPILRPRRKDSGLVQSFMEERIEEFTFPPSDEGDYVEYEQFLGEVKTAMVLQAWIEETGEGDLLDRYGVQPGDRYSAVTNAEWLLYATHAVAGILGLRDRRRHLGRLRDRVKHGVTEKLLPLVRLKGIGRMRARVLYNSGFATVASLKRAPVKRLVEIPLIGPRLAKSIKEQVGGLVEESEWRRLSEIESEQRALTEFIEEEYEEKQPD